MRVDPGPEGFWKFGEFDQDLPDPDSNPWRTSPNKMAPFDKEVPITSFQLFVTAIPSNNIFNLKLIININIIIRILAYSVASFT